ncbi:hypothetical protein [Sphingomonas sp. KR3-1]|uniref:hypothetical protein n=1 Tax=Sphingomonas sp. KR3-1 TaxID=3156611 RepID=UPI0032B3FD3C
MTEGADADRRSAAAAEAMLRIRRERVHTTMLIELFVLLVFLAIAFAFFQKDPRHTAVDQLRSQIDKLESQLKDAKADISRLRGEREAFKRKYEEVAEANRRLINQVTGTAVANDRIMLTRTQYDQVMERLNALALQLDASQAQSKFLQAKLDADPNSHGKDLPPCEVNAKFLLTIDMLGNGNFRVHPAWAPSEAAGLAAVPGLTDLTGSSALTPAKFRSYAGQIKQWGMNQRPIPCGFRAKWERLHANPDLSDKQRNLISQYFYIPA